MARVASAWGIFACVILCCLQAIAEDLEFALSPIPVGSGGRAAGMADAFVAIADDATAASWNPAGLVQLELPEVSIVGSFNALHEKFDTPFHPETEARNSDSNVDLNYLSLVYPLPWLILGRNATVSLNYQRKYDFSRDIGLDLDILGGVSWLRDFEFTQNGGLSTLTPAFAIEITNRLSVGVSFNFWRSSFLSRNSWQQRTRSESYAYFAGGLVYTHAEDYEKYKNFSGENLTLGIMWNATDKLSFGARYDTAFTGRAAYSRVGATTRLVYGLPWPFGLNVTPRVQEERRDIRFPASLALGVAYRFNDRFTLSFDATRTEWDDFYLKNRRGRRVSLVNGGDIDDILAPPQFDPTYTLRLGAEYVFLPREGKEEERLKYLWTLRGGVFFDQEPATGVKTTSIDFLRRGNGKPDDFWGAALGVGLLAHQRVNIDLAYQLRFGHDVNSDFIRGIPGGFSEDVYQHRFLISAVVYLGG